MSSPFPPLNPLRAFECAARAGSLTQAAEELNVSQVAVSRQVKVLEEYLGVALFHRLHRGIELTEEGRRLYEGVRGPLQEIANATRQVSRRGRRDILSIQSYTTFSHRWLLPRLAQFHEEFPRVEVRLSSSPLEPEIGAQNFDAVISSGYGDWPDLQCARLAELELIPVCSPSFQQTHGLRDPADLSKIRLLHSMKRPNDWRNWLAHVGQPVDGYSGIKFENSTLAYEAAMMDIGVAITMKVFAKRHLQAGLMVAPFEQSFRPGESYYLTWRKDVTPSLPLRQFLGWIQRQMEAELGEA